jgi:hypothetical protein
MPARLVLRDPEREIERQIREDVLERTMWIDTGDDTTRQGRRALENPAR